MRRALWSRLIAGWLACWLPLVLADAGWLHACPMHDGAAMVASAAMPAAAMSGPAAHEMGHAAAGGAHHAVGDTSHEDHAKGHCCTCLGACCAAVAALPAGSPPLTFAVRERVAVAPTGRPEHEYVAAWVDFVLPFATAPPALS